jgi:imidazolonepropionase-like amidohydrolase
MRAMSDETLIFRGARVHRGHGTPPEDGLEVVVQGRHIAAVREAGRSAPSDARVVDVSGRHLAPGFIDPHVHMGVMPEGFPNDSKDLCEMTSPVTPQMQAIDAVWPGDTAFVKARAAGVTTVCVLPGSGNVVSGTGVVLKTHGRNVEKMAVLQPACLKVAFGYNVKHSHGIKANRAPLTRMGIAALFRQAFEDAQLYAAKRAKDPETPRDAGKETLCAAMRGELVVRAHCSRSDDILTALRLARTFGLRLVLEHGYDAHLVLDEVKAAGAAVVFGPAFRTCDGSENLHFDFAQTRALDDAGVLVAHMTDHPIVPVEYLSVQAGLSVRAGMAPARALALITGNAARVLGLEARVGDIAPGLDADFVLLDGPPLAIESRVLETRIEGRVVYTHGDPIPVPGTAFFGEAP